MNKKIVLFLCFGIAIVLMAIYWLRPARNPVVALNKTESHAVDRSIETLSAAKIVPQSVMVAIGQNSNQVAETEPVLTNAPADVAKETADQAKYRLLRALRAWAAKDPEAALAAAMKLPAGDERNEALSAVCFGLAETDPADAVKMAQTLHLDNQPGAVMETLAQQWATTDLSSALDWANSQPAGGQRDGITTRIAYVMSQNDPADAANLVINQISAGPAQDEAVMTVLNRWANQNLAAAATWVKGFPAGPLQARAVNELQGIANYQQALAH